MSTESNTSNVDESTVPTDIPIPLIVRFWIILPFYIPSVICSFFVLYHFIFNRTIRQAIHNHAITILLFINLILQLTNIPWILNFYRLGYVWPQTPALCLAWTFSHEVLAATIIILFSWATIERHILIFHDRLVATRNKLILFHWLPIGIILIYNMSYNSFAVIFPPCENTFDYTQLICGDPLCFYDIQVVALWDVLINDITPAVIIIVCSIALLLRIVYQKHQIHQAIRWRNHRKMTIQLLSISVLYLVVYIPMMLMEFMYFCGVSEDVGADYMVYAEFISRYGNMLLPFVCAGSMPELKTKIRNIFPCWQRHTRAVGPETFTVSRHIAVKPVNTRGFV